MNVVEIKLEKLYVSPLNVRKILTNINSEEDITVGNLSENIKIHGLLNPLTVRKGGGGGGGGGGGLYEILAGQRRYLAVYQLGWKTVPCNIVDVDNQTAEELSLIENIQRNQMTNADKVRIFKKLNEAYNGDVSKITSSIRMSKPTIEKYLKIGKLPNSVIALLDKKGKAKITIEVAVELTKIDSTRIEDIMDIVEAIIHLNSEQKIATINNFIKSDYNMDTLSKDNTATAKVVKKSHPPPYIIDNESNMIEIPKELYGKVLKLIENWNVL
jgi:ParB/RepB/Spo0J family partition protein